MEVPPLLKIELLMKSVEKEDINIALTEWEWVLGDIGQTTNDQPGAICDFTNSDGRCVCGTAIRWVYQIRNKLNEILIPENPERDEGIGCICLLHFIPEAKEKYKLLKQEQRIRENKKKKKQHRKENPDLYCWTCKSFLKGKPTCKKCRDDIENCTVIGCKRKKLKFSMCRTCCKERKLL